jgi:hypothetical protein
MLDVCECPEAVVLQFEHPFSAREWLTNLTPSTFFNTQPLDSSFPRLPANAVKWAVPI